MSASDRTWWHQVACRCSPSGVHHGRRRWLLGAAGALGAGAIAACSTPDPARPRDAAASPGTTPAAAPRPPVDTSPAAARIDVHHHVSPPGWVEALKARGAVDPLVLSWTPERSLADMDRAGIATAILSITTPGIFMDRLSVDEGRRVARACNEYAADLAARHRGRFGWFAALPLLDAEGSLREAAHALDVLKADGIGLITSYGDKWLGDPAFFRVLEELDRRRALVYTHPTAANCCANLQREVPPVMIEFGTDTTRTIASIVFGGAAQRYPNIRWIFSHAGGSTPFLIERFVRHPLLAPQVAPLFPQGVRPVLQRFWYDTAQTANAAAMSALTKVVPASQIVLGTDLSVPHGARPREWAARLRRLRCGGPAPDRARHAAGPARAPRVARPRTPRPRRAPRRRKLRPAHADPCHVGARAAPKGPPMPVRHPRLPARRSFSLAATALALAAAFAPLSRAQAHSEAKVTPPYAGTMPPPTGASETAVLAGGCFWGVQGVFQHVKGVTNAVSGYAGGDMKSASYPIVSSGLTAHAEAVKVTYDPRQVSYAQILQIFFSVAHDPTQLNRQGPDHGPQYRSAIFPATAEQAQVAQAYIAQLDNAKVWSAPIVTKIESGKAFFPAEDYHQDFLVRNPTYPYIVWNDLPKIEDLKRLFPAAYRPEPVLVAQAKKAG